jgi:hypothetical protein
VIPFAGLRHLISATREALGRSTGAVLARSAEMRDWINQQPTVFHPSRFWNHLSTEDDKILARMKIENFKRCLPQHYFNWPIDYPGNPQFTALLRSWIDNPSFAPLRTQLRGSARVIHVPAQLKEPSKEWYDADGADASAALSWAGSFGVVVMWIVRLRSRPLRSKPISMPIFRRKVAARRSRPASARGLSGHVLTWRSTP